MGSMGYVNYLKGLERSQWFKRKDLEKLQERKLRYLLKTSYKHVPYYHDLFKKAGITPEEIRSLDDLEKIPVLTRESLKTQTNRFIANNIDPRKLIPDYTSGTTTGERLSIKRLKETYDRAISAELRAYRWYGAYRKMFYYVTGTDVDVEKNRTLKKRLYNFVTKTITISPLEFSMKKRLDRFLKELKKNKRRVLYGTPSGICKLVDILDERNIDINLDVIISTDEPLLKEQRKYLEDRYGCEVYDIYGTSEVWGIAFECSLHGLYHITSENVIVEVVNENWERVSPGERGRILLTDLNNTEMPIIRYDIGDFGIISDDECECGRGLHALRPIDGQMVLRETNYILSSSGKKIFLPEFGFLLEDHSKVKQFQILQRSRKKILVRIVKGRDYDKKTEESIFRRLLSLLGDVEIEFRYVKDIPFDKNGEHRYVMRTEFTRSP